MKIEITMVKYKLIGIQLYKLILELVLYLAALGVSIYELCTDNIVWFDSFNLWLLILGLYLSNVKIYGKENNCKEGQDSEE